MKNFQRMLVTLTLILCTVLSCTMPAAEVAVESGVELNAPEVLPENVKVGYLGNKKIYYEIVDGKKVFQDDIVLADNQVADTPSRGTIDDVMFWPNGSIPYYLDNLSPALTGKVREAIYEWKLKTRLDLHEITSPTSPNYIAFIASTNNKSTSRFGMTGGRQNIELATDASIGDIIHLIGHSVGLAHEHSHENSYKYITTNWSNIQPAKRLSFSYEAPETYSIANFDFDSIMLLPSYITDPELVIDTTIPTFTKKDGTTYLAQRERLSQGDVLAVNTIYELEHYLHFPLHEYYQLFNKHENGVKLISGDFNGDGFDDLIKQDSGVLEQFPSAYNEHFMLYYSEYGDFSLKRFTGEQYQTDLRGEGANIIPGDFNGDGITDFIRQEKNHLDNDNINTFKIYFGNRYFNYNIVTPAGDKYQKLLKGDQTVLIPGDFNGDKKTDFIRQEIGDWANDGIQTITIYFSNGDGTFNDFIPQGDEYQKLLNGNLTNLIVGDFNNDNKCDFIRQEKNGWDADEIHTFAVYFSNGDGTFNDIIPSGDTYQNLLKGKLANIIPGDFNGDGKTDFIRQRKSANPSSGDDKAFIFYYSQGDGTFDTYAPQGYIYQGMMSEEAGCNIVVGDYDNNGKDDFVRQARGLAADDISYNFMIYFTK